MFTENVFHTVQRTRTWWATPTSEVAYSLQGQCQESILYFDQLLVTLVLEGMRAQELDVQLHIGLISFVKHPYFLCLVVSS